MSALGDYLPLPSFLKAKKENPTIFNFIKEKTTEIAIRTLGLATEKLNEKIDEVAEHFAKKIGDTELPDLSDSEEICRFLEGIFKDDIKSNEKRNIEEYIEGMLDKNNENEEPEDPRFQEIREKYPDNEEKREKKIRKLREVKEFKMISDNLDELGKFLKINPDLIMLVFGVTQCGKTTSIKRLINATDIIIKDGTKSDTTKITDYRFACNGGTLHFVDSPGFFDSRGHDSRNYRKLFKYIKNTNVNIFCWFYKLSDISNYEYKNKIKLLLREVGLDILSRSIIVLTYANENPPEEYIEAVIKGKGKGKGPMYPDDSDSDSDSIIEFTEDDIMHAWIDYSNNKKEMWLKAFLECVEEVDPEFVMPDIPIVLIENNPANGKFNENGDILLKDGTPCLQSFMENVLSILPKESAITAFKIIKGNKEVTNKTIKLDNHQRTLKKAVDEVITNSSSTGNDSWWSRNCVIL